MTEFVLIVEITTLQLPGVMVLGILLAHMKNILSEKNL